MNPGIKILNQMFLKVAINSEDVICLASAAKIRVRIFYVQLDLACIRFSAPANQCTGSGLCLNFYEIQKSFSAALWVDCCVIAACFEQPNIVLFTPIRCAYKQPVCVAGKKLTGNFSILALTWLPYPRQSSVFLLQFAYDRTIFCSRSRRRLRLSHGT